MANNWLGADAPKPDRPQPTPSPAPQREPAPDRWRDNWTEKRDFPAKIEPVEPWPDPTKKD